MDPPTSPPPGWSKLLHQSIRALNFWTGAHTTLVIPLWFILSDSGDDQKQEMRQRCEKGHCQILP